MIEKHGETWSGELEDRAGAVPSHLLCKAESSPGSDSTWTCTLPQHPSWCPHIAADGNRVLAIWHDGEGEDAGGGMTASSLTGAARYLQDQGIPGDAAFSAAGEAYRSGRALASHRDGSGIRLAFRVTYGKGTYRITEER